MWVFSKTCMCHEVFVVFVREFGVGRDFSCQSEHPENQVTESCWLAI